MRRMRGSKEENRYRKSGPVLKKRWHARYNVHFYVILWSLSSNFIKSTNLSALSFQRKVLHKLHVGHGDMVTLTESSQGFQMTGVNQEFSRAMKVYGDLAERYRNTLDELSK